MNSETKDYTPNVDWHFQESSEAWRMCNVTYKRRCEYEKLIALFEVGRDGKGKKWVCMEHAKKEVPGLASQMGGSNGSSLYTRGPIGDAFITECKKKGGKITHRRVIGFNYARQSRRHIPDHLRKIIIKRPCEITGSRSNIEADHRDGRYSNIRLNDPSLIREGDLMALSKSGNSIKREACKRCILTDNRYDARNLGYNKGWIRGGEKYEGTCDGCYMHGPRLFRRCFAFVDAEAERIWDIIDQKRKEVEDNPKGPVVLKFE